MSYQPAVYREQGGAKLVVASGGEAEVQSGGTLDLQSGATITLAANVSNTGTITNSSDGTIKDSVTTETTGATLTNYGISVCEGSTKYGLTSPVAGCFKHIISSTGTAVITSTAAVIGESTRGHVKITLSKENASISLFGISATRWGLIGMTTGCATA